jgi:hypothetical protein
MGCLVSLQPDYTGQNNFWTLGQPFLRAFFTVFDKDNNRLGFVPSFDVPLPALSYNYKVLIIIVSVIGGVIILSILLCIVLYKCS